MFTEKITFKNTGYFSSLICDYMAQSKDVKDFYGLFPELENFKTQLKNKSFSQHHRDTLVSVLDKQYKDVDASANTLKHIDLLKKENTFTITTGHQLNLFTGPLYFLYKIISTINLTKVLKENYPKYHFVPMYWMASEDHDFDEICYFNFKNQKITWPLETSGAVGRLRTKGLDEVLKVIESLFGVTKQSKELQALFKKAYIENDKLASATRVLANALFKDEGLVILDADDQALKSLFIPHMKDEILNSKAKVNVEQTNQCLKEKNYPQTAHPRSINLFYLKDGNRKRIDLNKSFYEVVGTSIKFNEKDILKELNNYPERFSPNVILRPLYQEVILPNLCYIGGGGEIAYWMQLKQMFNDFEVTFPILLLRNSALIVSKKQLEKLKKLNINTKELFLKTPDLIDQKIRELSQINIDFSPQKQLLKEQFKALFELSKKTDASFVGAVSAQQQKQIKGLEHLEKRLLKAQKRKYKDHTERITILKQELFPNESLQERYKNFSELYLEYGKELIPQLLKHLNPLSHHFLVLTI